MMKMEIETIHPETKRFPPFQAIPKARQVRLGLERAPPPVRPFGLHTGKAPKKISAKLVLTIKLPLLKEIIVVKRVRFDAKIRVKTIKGQFGTFAELAQLEASAIF
jgi:hypothetical protein